MKRFALMSLVACAAPGCFYFPPINQRPSVSIRQLTDGTAYRGQPIQLEAVASDPDNDFVIVSWRVYACTEGVDPTPDCDGDPFQTGSVNDFDVTVPATRADGTTPVRALRVLLDAKDDRGAAARPEQELVIAVGDMAPALVLRKDSLHDFVVGSHISLFADVADADDGPVGVTLAWTVFPPTSNATFTLTADAAPPAVDGHRGEAQTLVADATGDWGVRVVATDSIGQTTEQDFTITVAADLPPCIDSESPVAQEGETLPLFEATAFEVPSVADDLDTYPPLLGDIDAGVAAFSWTLQTNGGARVTLPIAGNLVELDPAAFHAGDVLELRVEIADRVPRAANFAACGDVAATCTFNPDAPTCSQRETWRVEVQ